MQSALTRIITAALALVALMPATASAHPRLDGTLVVENARLVPVSVRIDGAAPRFVAAGDRGVFPRVPNGLRRVVIDSAGAAPQVERVRVPAGGRAFLRAAALVGSARFTNNGPAPLRLIVDGRPLGVVGPGQSLPSGPLRPGLHSAAARRAGPAAHRHGHAPVREQRFEVAAGDDTRVELAARAASLEVLNPFPRRVSVFLDGVRVGKLRPGRAMTLRDKAAGRYRLSLEAHGRVLADEVVVLRPGARERWEPMVALAGSLRVLNTTPRRLELRVDGRRHPALAPGESRLLRDVAVGHHEIVARGRGIVVRRGVDVRPRAEALVAIGPVSPLAVSDAQPRPMWRR
ncbi:MAG: hypothetical protein H6744_03525 [Deltaproteobacteria bacterium]|nr:hypothetical protein [Deltaproteobacteria bacterium]